ncbi:MAG TPA: OmpA family protein, partial [Thermoanaerobaculia bacterium]|nr:OmpA family protein [Thermoanaerobaculia bacterium]
MKRIPVLAASILFAAAAVSIAADATLNLIQYPDKRSVDVPFVTTQRAPAGATVEAEVKLAEGQARVDLSYKKMQPAALFGGNIAAYVVWAVNRAGLVENLGELWIDDVNGSARYQTGMKEFALFVTAEPVPGIWRPSDFVIFWSGPTKSEYARNSTLAFSAFGRALKHDRESIGTLTWTGKEPIVLYQARRAYEVGSEMGLDKYDEKSMTEAKTTLAQATNSQGSGGSKKAVTDYSRRTVALVTTAARAMYQAEQEKAAAEAAAKRKAELDAAEAARKNADDLRLKAESEKNEAEKAKAELAATAAALAAQKSDLEAQMAAIDSQKKELEIEMAALAVENQRTAAERDALAQRLVGALATVADTQSTARGVVVSLSDILFDTGKATLKSSAQISLAKMCGVLSVFPNLNLRIEGHTDSTGSDEINDKLSRERAAAVVVFLQGQGIAGSRMNSDGYGSKFPVASNETNDGRAKNRRVEVI